MLGQNKEALNRFRNNVRLLICQDLPEALSIDETLAGLAEKRNPLFDRKARQDLVKDVNALVRDFIRAIRKSFLTNPPNLTRIYGPARAAISKQGPVNGCQEEPAEAVHPAVHSQVPQRGMRAPDKEIIRRDCLKYGFHRRKLPQATGKAKAETWSIFCHMITGPEAFQPTPSPGLAAFP